MKTGVWLSVAGMVLAAGCHVATAEAAPITLLNNTLNMFRDTRGANDVGIGQGDVFQFGASIAGGSAGTSLGATYLPTGTTIPQFACAPLAVNPNFCGRVASFNPSMLGQWQLKFTNGPDTLLANAPSLSGTETPMPFPVNVTISSSGTTTQPVISWDVPQGIAPDGFRVQIYDKSKILANGQADIIHSVAVAPNSTSYQLPATLSTGQALAQGGNYTINFQVIETRGHTAFTNNNAEILRRSNSFFAFTPVNSNAPPNVVLPTVSGGVYHFNVTNVGPNSITFIDPFVAIGYQFAIGVGDPNFASVLLPDIGDGIYTVEFEIGGNLLQETVLANAQFFFPQGGVDAFTVLGIETSAGVDPNNVTAFITGLTFVAPGNFTGTMTPITVFVPDQIAVPEPETIVILISGLVALLGWRRKSWAAAF